MSNGAPLMLPVHMLSLLLTPLPVHVWSFEHVPLLMQALSRALPGDASIYLLLGMLRNAKGNKEAAANAYAAAVRISMVGACRSPVTAHLCLIVKPCLLLVHMCSHDAKVQPTTALQRLSSHSSTHALVCKVTDALQLCLKHVTMQVSIRIHAVNRWTGQPGTILGFSLTYRRKAQSFLLFSEQLVKLVSWCRMLQCWLS